MTYTDKPQPSSSTCTSGSEREGSVWTMVQIQSTISKTLADGLLQTENWPLKNTGPPTKTQNCLHRRMSWAQTLKQIFQRCPARHALRQQTWPEEIELWISSQDLEKTIEYVVATGLQVWHRMQHRPQKGSLQSARLEPEQPRHELLAQSAAHKMP